MTINDLHDLLVHELRDIYDAENRLIKATGQLAKEARDPEIADLFKMHQAQTEEQVGRLERAFEAIGLKARKQACTGIMGIIEEHKSFKDDKPAKEILAAFDLGAGLKTEHYEIAAYQSLIGMADALQLEEVSELLKQNLGEEQAMAEKLLAFAPKGLEAILPEEAAEEEEAIA